MVVGVLAVIFVIVEVVLIYSICRFRKKANDDKEPPQVYGSNPIEIAWTAAPAVIVFLLTMVLIRTVFEVSVEQDDPPACAVTLRVAELWRQWRWVNIYS